MEIFEFLADINDEGERLDVFLYKKIPNNSRSYYQNLIKQGLATVNEKKVKPNHRIKNKQQIRLEIPEPRKISLEPQEIDIDIIYEDDDIAVINKQKGLVVHPAPGNYSGTLVNALLYKCNNLSGINGEIRPGIVHRIDKDTSGLLVIAKNNKAHNNLAEQIKNKTVKRVYWAIVENNVANDSGTIDKPIGRHPVQRKKMAVTDTGSARNAVTHYRVIERLGIHTLIEARLETGRTHQIRVHMAYIGHPIVGDTVYGSKKQKFNTMGQVLHAKHLTLVHPTTNKIIQFEAPVPEYFKKLLNILREKSKKV